MTMYLKLAYCAFSSSSSKDSKMNTLWGFSSLCVEVKALDDFFPFQNVIANLFVFVPGVCVTVCVHALNKDFSQAVIGTFYQCHFQNIVGWVVLKFFSLC